MSEEQSAYAVTGDGSGVALPEVVEWPEIQVTSNAPAYADGTLTLLQPERDAGIRALFDEVLDDLRTWYRLLDESFGNERELHQHRLTSYRARLGALLGARLP